MERFAVIGLGRFGRHLATLLAEAGAEVIAVDQNRDIVESVRDRVALAVCLNSLDEEALVAQGIDKVDVAVVGMGSGFEDSALTTLLLKRRLGVPKVVSRATSQTRAEILSGIGADQVVNPEREAAERWCSRLMAPAILERIVVAAGHSLVQVPAPENFHGKTLEELNIRKKYKVNVVAIRRTIEETDDDGNARTRQLLISVPMPGSTIEPNDVLVLIGSDEAIADFPTD